VLAALREFRGVIWHAESRGETSPRIFAHQRALGPFTGLAAKTLIAKQTIEVNDEVSYGDVGWLNHGAAPQLERLYNRSTATIDSLVAFFRNPDLATLKRWNVALIGALWAWARSLSSTHRRRPSDSDHVVLKRLLQMALEENGVLALLADVEGAGRVLLLVGRRDTCRELTSRLKPQEPIDWLDSVDAIGRSQWIPWLT
jgi:hypothetical protein